MKKFLENGHRLKLVRKLVRDDTHMTSMNIAHFQDPPSPLSIYIQHSSSPLTLDVQFQTNPPTLLQMIQCMRTNEIKTKTKPSHATFKLTTRSILRFCSTNNIIKRQLHCLTSKGKFLVNNINIWLSVMSDHDANPIFFNKKKRKKKRLDVQNTR